MIKSRVAFGWLPQTHLGFLLVAVLSAWSDSSAQLLEMDYDGSRWCPNLPDNRIVIFYGFGAGVSSDLDLQVAIRDAIVDWELALLESPLGEFVTFSEIGNISDNYGDCSTPGFHLLVFRLEGVDAANPGSRDMGGWSCAGGTLAQREPNEDDWVKCTSGIANSSSWGDPPDEPWVGATILFGLPVVGSLTTQLTAAQIDINSSVVGGNTREVLRHEIGHVLGLGHTPLAVTAHLMSHIPSCPATDYQIDNAMLEALEVIYGIRSSSSLVSVQYGAFEQATSGQAFRLIEPDLDLGCNARTQPVPRAASQGREYTLRISDSGSPFEYLATIDDADWADGTYVHHFGLPHASAFIETEVRESGTLVDVSTTLYPRMLRPSALGIVPERDRHLAIGSQGGAILPECGTYELTNNTEADIVSWAVTCAEAWVEITPAVGTLVSRESARVQVCVNAVAQTLAEGRHVGSCLITADLNGVEIRQRRGVEVLIEGCGGGPELCNSLDDDCDGLVDEDFSLGVECQAGVGACATRGLTACASDGDVYCDAIPGVPMAEICNGIDDDCNGTTDDEARGGPISFACYTGPQGTANVGACHGGVATCASGQFGSCEGEALPTPETCNAVDDDCNGATDDMGAISCGIGECSRSVPVCTDGVDRRCEPGLPQLEVCNGLDDDCDGAFDEGFDPRTCKTWTTDADFDLGLMSNVVHSVPDQLQLDDRASPFNFIWVAVSTKGTTVKIDTETGEILGEYRTAPEGQPTDPSRTTVDLNGNVWNTNRAGHSVVHIGLKENNQCVDRNGNGEIDTSTGLNDIRRWTNAGGVDSDGGVDTADDECILHYVLVRASGTRHVAVTSGNDVWVSGTGANAGAFDLIDGDTGDIIRAENPVGYGGYGGLIDGNGVIWSARPLLRWDTSEPLSGPNGGGWRGYGHDSYGLCIDSHGNVWNTALFGNRIYKFAPDGTQIGVFGHGFDRAQGCVVGTSDDVWVAHVWDGPANVGHIKNDGTFVGNVPVSSGPTGVAVDAAGKIWSTDYHSGRVSRIDPTAGPIGADGVTPVGQVDFTSPNLGGNLYNYSDMTGSTLRGAPRSGSWEVQYDSGRDETIWRFVHWKADALGDGGVSVLLSTSADGETFTTPQPVTNGQELTNLSGRFIKARVVFNRAATGESPILYNFTVVSGRPPVALCKNVTLSADDRCQACVSVDDGSYDPDGSAFSLSEAPGCPYGLGASDVTLTITDPDQQTSSCVGTVTVVDSTPPIIELTPMRALWPPNHQYAIVSLSECVATVRDNCSGLTDVRSAGHILSVYSDEPEDVTGNGDGATLNDIEILDDTTLRLRVERQGGGNGRVYGVRFLVVDPLGNPSEALCTVGVFHDQGGGANAVDDGPDAGYLVTPNGRVRPAGTIPSTTAPMDDIMPTPSGTQTRYGAVEVAGLRAVYFIPSNLSHDAQRTQRILQASQVVRRGYLDRTTFGRSVGR